MGPFVSIIANLLVGIAKKGLAPLSNDNIFELAINNTEKYFSEKEGIEFQLSESLKGWIIDERTQDQLEKYIEGERQIDYQVLGQLLIENDFGYGDKTEEYAPKVIAVFLKDLYREILRTDDAVLLLYERVEVLAVDIVEEIRKSQSETRDLFSGPPMSPELRNLLTSTYDSCILREELVTRAHLFNCLLSNKLDDFHFSKPLLASVRKMLKEFSERLKANVFTQNGFQVTDSFKEIISLARLEAKHLEESELGVKRLLLTLLEDPGENILKGMSKYNITPAEIISSIRIESPGW